MLEEVLRHLKNWFVYDFRQGTYTIEDGQIIAQSGAIPHLMNGQYFRITGSVFNNGVHQYPADDLTNETFAGQIWALAIPKALMDTVQEIAAWQEKNGEGAASPYTSESFGGYSYTKASNGGSGGAVTWESAFRNRLNIWRKI